jgi:hypothetical protein
MRAMILAGLAGLMAGCALDGTPIEAVDLDAIEFHVCGPDMGVYPDESVLVDLDNPFRLLAVGDATKWDVQSSGNTVAAFFSWATITARAPHGEAQYYAAVNLKAIVDHELATAEQLPIARDLAIRGFQALLDNFPDSVTYDATGTIAYDLATPSYLAIVDLGGQPLGWILVETSNGPRAIPI